MAYPSFSVCPLFERPPSIENYIERHRSAGGASVVMPTRTVGSRTCCFTPFVVVIVDDDDGLGTLSVHEIYLEAG